MKCFDRGVFDRGVMATGAPKRSWGGTRRGSGRKKKSGSDYVSVGIYSETYQRWNALKDRLCLPTNNSVAEYLLNLSDSFDLHPEG